MGDPLEFPAPKNNGIALEIAPTKLPWFNVIVIVCSMSSRYIATVAFVRVITIWCHVPMVGVVLEIPSKLFAVILLTK